MSSEKILMLVVFNVAVPSLDLATDINMVRKLLTGPEDEFRIYSGEIILGLENLNNIKMIREGSRKMSKELE